MLDHGHVDEAAAYLIRYDLPSGFPFGVVPMVMKQVADEEVRRGILRAAIEAWRTKRDTPFQRGEFIQMFQTQWMYPLQVRNMGKTSAKNIDMSIFVDILGALQEVPLGRISNPTDDPHGHISAGIVFPNEDFKHVVTRPGKDGQPLPLTDLEATAMNNGKAYLAIYGIVTYDDVFKVHHFTKFCDYRGTVGASTLKVQSCVAYNDADNDTENEK
jgi:hypothetical protein